MSRRWYVYVPIGLAILAVLVWRTRPWEALDAVGRARPAWLLVAVLLNVVIVLGWTLRSQRLLRRLGHPIALLEAAPIVAFANTVAGLTPASVGEALRAVVLQRRHDIPYRVGAAVILVERLGSLYLLAAWTIVTLTALALPASIRLPSALLAGATCVLLPVALARSGVGIARPIGALAAALPTGRERARRISRGLAEVEDLVRQVVADTREVGWFAAWTAVVFGAGAAQLLAVATALGGHLDPMAGWAALATGLLTGILSTLPFGLGAADAALVTGLVVAGVPAAMATVVALLLRAVNNIPLTTIGVAAYLHLQSRDPRSEDPDRA